MGRNPVSRYSMQRYIMAYYRLGKRELLIALISHQEQERSDRNGMFVLHERRNRKYSPIENEVSVKHKQKIIAENVQQNMKEPLLVLGSHREEGMGGGTFFFTASAVPHPT